MNTAPLRAQEPPLDPDVQSAFQEQSSQPMLRAALRYAQQRASLVRRVGRPVDNLYARELVQDALTDTWMGTIAWRPDRVPLLDHIRSVIRWRTWKDVLGAVRAPHVSFERDRRASALSFHGTGGNVSPLVVAGLIRRIVTELRLLAVEDYSASLVLDAWSKGHVECAEVMDHTGLDLKEYRAARARLTYLALDLPNSLRDAAKHVLRSGS